MSVAWVQHKESATGKGCNMKLVQQGNVQYEKCAV